MGDNLQDHGLITICMVTEFIHGKMEGDMKDIMKWTKNTDMVFIFGLMAEGMREIGQMGNSMGKENTYYQIVQ